MADSLVDRRESRYCGYEVIASESVRIDGDDGVDESVRELFILDQSPNQSRLILCIPVSLAFRYVFSQVPSEGSSSSTVAAARAEVTHDRAISGDPSEKSGVVSEHSFRVLTWPPF